MLAEFAVAVVVFSKAIQDKHEEEEEEKEEISYLQLKAQIEDIIGQSYPEVLKYYHCCVKNGHKNFTWTGPSVKIVPRSEAWSSVLPYSTSSQVNNWTSPTF